MTVGMLVVELVAVSVFDLEFLKAEWKDNVSVAERDTAMAL